MPGVPEFLLRKLYVAGSFKKLADGFSFELTNTLMPVSVTAMQVSTENLTLPPEDLSLQFQGQAEINSQQVNSSAFLHFVIGLPLTIRARTDAGEFTKLFIKAQTVELGELSFSIPLAVKKPNQLHKFLQNFTKSLSTSLRVQKVKKDPLHPIYHFTPPANWMNDPNGLVSWQGQTHLFYQYNPNEVAWGSIHWGHAVSKDLVHWRRLPVAMAPQSGTPNTDGCWSGSAYVTEEGPVFVYTAVFPETVCMAKPDASFQKLLPIGNAPIISAPPAGLNVEGFRDPVMWKENERFYLSLGSGIKGEGGAVFLYESTDMQHWTYLHPLLQGDLKQKEPFATGFMWECPQMFRLEDEYFLFVSGMIEPGNNRVFYFQGSYADNRFQVRSQHLFDSDYRAFYAPLSFEDERARRIQFGWLREERSEEVYRRAGWAGALSLPRWLKLAADKSLLVAPAPEVQLLRKKMICSFSGELEEELRSLSGKEPVVNVELKAVLRADSAGQVVIKLAETPEAEECTLVTYLFSEQKIRVDTRKTNLDTNCIGEVKEASLELAKGEAVNLDLFLDGSVLEIYINDRVVLSGRYYPRQIRKNALYAAGRCGKIYVESLILWRMGNCIVK